MREIRVAHLYPEYLNIYADRGNIAVFERRAALRGHQRHELEGVGDKLDIHFSAGFATYPVHGKTIEEIIHVADTALYESKAKRKSSKQ